MESQTDTPTAPRRRPWLLALLAAAGLSATLLVVAGIAFAAWSLTRPHVPPEFDPQHPQFSRVESSLLDPGQVRLVAAHAGAPGAPLVILAGENHAQRATQEEVAAWLDGLLAAQAIDGLLLEGSQGPLQWQGTETAVRAVLGEAGARVYWQSQLEAGQISGVECAFLLRRPSIDLVGIEDVALKDASEKEFLLGDPVQWRAEDAVEDNVRRQLSAAVESGPEAARAVVQSYATARDAARVRRAEALPKIEELAAIEEAMPTKADAYERRVTAYNARIADLQSEFSALQAEIASFESDARDYNRTVARGGGSDWEYQQLDRRQGEIASRVAHLNQQQEEVATEHGAIDAVERELKDLADRHTALGAYLTRYTEASEAADQALLAAADAAAEALRATGRDTSVIDHVFTSRDRLAGIARESMPSLAGRDDAMIANAKAWWAGREQPVVVMLVGYAHLPSLQARLEKEGVAYVSLAFAAAEDPSDAADVAAWGLRLARSDPEHRKERSYFMGTLAPGFQKRSETFVKTGASLVAQLTPGQMTLRSLEGGREWLLRRRATGADPPRDWFGVANVETATMSTPDGGLVDVVVRDGDAVRARLGASGDDRVVFLDVAPAGSGFRYAIPDGEGSRAVSAAEAANFASAQAGAGKDVVLLTALTCDEAATQDIRHELWAAAGGSVPPGGPPWWPRTRFGQDPERARRNVEVLRRRDARDDRHVVVVLDPLLHPSDPYPANIDATALATKRRVRVSEGAQSIESMPWSPNDGSRSDTLLVVARNTQELRSSLRRAAANRKLENKEVVLVMCGHDGGDIDALSAELRAGGALGVIVFREALDPKEAQRFADALATRVDSLGGTTTWSQIVDESLKDAGINSTTIERHVLRWPPPGGRPGRG